MKLSGSGRYNAEISQACKLAGLQAFKQKMSVLVLGIGNVLMTDDSVGVRVVDEILRKFDIPEGVEILDGGTSGIELLTHIRDKTHLIIVDALKCGHAPGTVVRVEGEDVPAKFMTRISPHQLGLSDLLAAAKLTGETPGRMVLFGIEPKRIELGLELSDEVKAGFNKLVGIVVDEVRNAGFLMEHAAGGIPDKKSFWENV
jgi:hydrogenase maturation protease